MSDETKKGSKSVDDGPPLTRKEVMRQGWDRVIRSSAEVASFALDDAAGRFIPRVQRPPGALPAVEFLIACTRCDACVDACPPGAILRLAEGAGIAAGTPFLSVVDHKPCTACVDVPCAKACPTGALVVAPIETSWMGTAVLDRDSCRAWNGGECSSCLKICPIGEAAILADDDGRVYIDARGCIGCGLCVVVCPTRPRSIEVDPPSLV